MSTSIAPDAGPRGAPAAPSSRARWLRARLFPPVAEDAPPEEHVDAYVMGGARAIAIVLAVSLLALHLPVALLSDRDPSGVMLVLGLGLVSLVVGIAAFAAPSRLSGDAVAATVTAIAAGSFLASAMLPHQSSLDSDVLLLLVPTCLVSVWAYAPMRVSVAALTGGTVLVSQAVFWQLGLYDDSTSFHVLALSFTVNAGLAGILLCHVRRGRLHALYSHQQELREAQADTQRALDQLRDAQGMLLESERMAALGRLSAGLAHEINTPLAACRSGLEELRARVDELSQSLGHPDVTEGDLREVVSEAGEALDLAVSSASRAAGCVQDLKRQTAVMAHARDERFDALEELRSVVSLLRHRTKRTGVPIELGGDASASLGGDRAKLTQIATNLVGNAMDACASTGCTEPIRIEVADEGDAVEMRVIDRGPGIAPDVGERIFEPLFTTKGPGLGTGLGLSISQQLTREGFGGTITHHQTPGGGATFTVRIPRATQG